MSRLIRYTMNGVDVTYDIGFDVTDSDGFSVYVNSQKLDKSLDFTVIGNLDQLRDGEGKVTLAAPYTAGDKLLIISSTIERRVTNFAQAARFEEKEIDNEFDNLLRLLEDAALYLTAAPYFAPENIGQVNGQLPPVIAGAVIRVNDAGDGFDFVKIEDFPLFEEAIEAARQEADRSKNEAVRSGLEADAAEQSAQESEQSNQNAASNAELSRKWAEGDTPSGSAPSDSNNSKYYAGQAAQSVAQIPQLIANKIDKVGGDTGAARIPVGTEAQKPDTTSEQQALIRLSEELGWIGYNPITGEWTSLGGGLVKPKTPALGAYPYTVGKGEFVLVDVSDGVSKVVNVPTGWSAGDGFFIALTGWGGDPSVTAKIQTDAAQAWDHPEMSVGDSLVIGGNQAAALQVTNASKLKVVQAMGEESGEGWPKSGENERGRWVMHRDGTMDCYYTAALGFRDYTLQVGSLFKCPNQVWTYPKVFIEPPVVGVFGNTAVNQWLFASAADPSVSAVTYGVFTAASGTNIQTTIGLTAKGRWK